jgi:alpha-L-arabinofuranosidase
MQRNNCPDLNPFFCVKSRKSPDLFSGKLTCCRLSSLACVILFAIFLGAALPQSIRAQASLTDLGASNPTPGPNDISQLSTSGNTQLTGSFNYFTDNSSPPGQTFTVGTNSMMLTSLSLKTGSSPLDSGGGGLGPQPYQLQIFSVSGSTATLIATYTSSSSFSYADGDWLRWSGLNVGLTADATYAYSFKRLWTGYDGLAVSSGNPYSGGEAVLIPNGGGTMTYQSSHIYDAVFSLGLSAVPNLGPTNDDQVIYGERPSLNNGWQNWNYNSTLNFSNTAPVHSGEISMSANLPGYSRIWFVNNPMDVSFYGAFTFWVNGGPTGGQHFQVAASLNGTQGTSVNIGPLTANTWQQISVPLSSLGAANATNLNYLWIINPGGNMLPVFYVDDISLTAKAPPAIVHVGVNTTQIIRIVDARMFGINAADWDGYINTPTTISILTNMNNQVLRWPGGSGADVYFMSNSTSLANTRNFIQVATNTDAQVYFTVNYGTGTPAQAAAWVAFCNITNHCGFKYWEVGNESGGTWETDSNTVAPYQPHDPWTYAIRFKQYYTAMKAVDPTIVIGSSADVTEDGTANYNNHPVVNPRTGVTHNGWTPVMLYTMLTNGCICDFLIDHTYGPGNSDIGDLLPTPVWTVNANNLRQMLSDYLGASLSTNVELVATENGSGGNDRQLVSLVSGLYWADSLGQILQTEFNARIWWDLRNGQSDYPDSDNTLYGWRTDSNTGNYFGDLSIVAGLGDTAVNRYPAYYCGKLMKYFAGGGDTVVTATNDFKLLSAYAVQRANGYLTLLVVNKSCYANLNAAINLTGYAPATNAVAYSYGIPQDQAAFLNGSAAAMDIAATSLAIAGSNFTATFPPYSATVLQLAPVAPSLVTQPSQSSPGQFVFQLQGQSGVPYQIQMSTNLAPALWITISTNTPATGTLNLTYTMSFAAQFYRAIWQP